MAENQTAPDTADPTAVPQARTPQQSAKPAKAAKKAKATSSAAKKTQPAAEATDAPAKPAKKAATKAATKTAKKTTTKTAKKTAKPAKKVAGKTPAAPESTEIGVTPVPSAGTAAPAPAPADSHVPAGAWADAAWEAVRHPDQPPRRLVELAVTELGPRAAAWASWLRQTYPEAPADGLARLATRQAGRHGRLLTAAEAAGPAAATLQLPAMAAVRTLLVLRVAAAYGYDPTDQARVAEVIELLDLGAGRDRAPLARGLGLLATAVGRLRRRRPRAASALWALVSAGERRDGLERLAHRAARYYRPGSASKAAAARSLSQSAISGNWA